MKYLFYLGLILMLQSCNFLSSPVAIAVEEELAMDVLQIAEKELEPEPAKP